MHGDLLLIDDAAGRAGAKRRNLRVTGAPGVLRAGAEQRLVNVPELLERLKVTSSYLDETLLNTTFERRPQAIARGSQWRVATILPSGIAGSPECLEPKCECNRAEQATSTSWT